MSIGAQYTEKYGLWDPILHLDYNTFYLGIGQPYTRVELNPLPESTLSSSQGLRIWPLCAMYFVMYMSIYTFTLSLSISETRNTYEYVLS